MFRFLITFIGILSSCMGSSAQEGKDLHSFTYEKQGKKYVIVKSIPDGQHTYYNSDKKVITDGKFINGRFREGKKFYYNDQNILSRIAVYHKGLYIGDVPLEEETTDTIQRSPVPDKNKTRTP